MQQMQVTVPKGISPGMPFMVNTPTGQMQVTCPPGVSAGGQMLVNVPAPPVMVQAVPVPTGADQGGVVMGMVIPEQPMVQAMPMQQSMQREASPMGAGGGLPWRFSLQLDKKSRLSELKASSQSPIPVISPSEWAEIIAAIDETQRANFFYDCTPCEGVYWCFPGGPIQCAACFLNPITWILCICPVEAKKSAAKSKIEPIVSKYGLKFRWEDGMELCAVIEQ